MGFFGVTAIWAATGYLPQAGPVPLRFRPLPQAAAGQISQPVLLQGPAAAPLPPLSVKLPVPTAPAAPAAPVIAPTPATNPPAVEYDARDFGPGTLPAPQPDLIISPQMLIKYFSPSTNGNGVSGSAPVGFTPPTVAQPRTLPLPSRPTAPPLP